MNHLIFMLIKRMQWALLLYERGQGLPEATSLVRTETFHLETIDHLEPPAQENTKHGRKKDNHRANPSPNYGGEGFKIFLSFVIRLYLVSLYEIFRSSA